MKEKDDISECLGRHYNVYRSHREGGYDNGDDDAT
jgi:hypothetical protein